MTLTKIGFHIFLLSSYVHPESKPTKQWAASGAPLLQVVNLGKAGRMRKAFDRRPIPAKQGEGLQFLHPRPTQTPRGHAHSQGPRLVTPAPQSGARAHSRRVGRLLCCLILEVGFVALDVGILTLEVRFSFRDFWEKMRCEISCRIPSSVLRYLSYGACFGKKT